MKDLQGCGRGLILRYYPRGTEENQGKTSVRIAGRRGRDLNSVPPEYEAGVLNSTKE
jgi:hypothetical protein